MRNLIAGLILSCWAVSAQAQGVQNAQAVKIVTPFDLTCSSMAISNVTPTEVTLGNSTTPSSSANIQYLKVTNLDTSADLWCNQDSGVTTGTGEPIKAQPSASSNFNWLSWNIHPTRKWYCKSTGGGSTSAEVCRGK